MTSKPREHVFVLGAGFTKAFCPEAPLVVDVYPIDSISEAFVKFPTASRILRAEKQRTGDGKIDLERLMTRLDGLMPYDDWPGPLDALLRLLKSVLLQRLQAARTGKRFRDELSAFAGYCIDRKVSCVTFNYDDMFDESLVDVAPTYYKQWNTKPHWNPHSGYGFFCRPSIGCVGDSQFFWRDSAMFLLKLHGSINWYPKRGARSPYQLDAIVHHEDWLTEWSKESQRQEFTLNLARASIHLESEPFVVPPVLFKSELGEQPILKLVWAWAYRKLSDARNVTFVGYSMPTTDIAAGFLFGETLDRTRTEIKVVNFARTQSEQETLKQAYRKVLPWLTDGSFEFRDALDWSRELVASNIKTTDDTSAKKDKDN